MNAMPKLSSTSNDSVQTPSAATLYRAEHQQDVLNRLRRIEGQVRGLSEMIQAGRDCEEVAQQMTATRRAMDKAFFRMMTCTVIEAATSAGSQDAVMSEIERKAKLLEKYG
jgi:CsoR family transcriptional regulator, copper-sensing transcriptional repressor